jgi:hypothetical protein
MGCCFTIGNVWLLNWDQKPGLSGTLFGNLNITIICRTSSLGGVVGPRSTKSFFRHSSQNFTFKHAAAINRCYFEKRRKKHEMVLMHGATPSWMSTCFLKVILSLLGLVFKSYDLCSFHNSFVLYILHLNSHSSSVLISPRCFLFKTKLRCSKFNDKYDSSGSDCCFRHSVIMFYFLNYNFAYVFMILL